MVGKNDMYLDLHVHTTASDGQYTPTEIISMAKNIGLEIVAITDHDTVEGIAEGRKIALNLGIQFVAGIEISTQDMTEVHILGLGIDEENPMLCERCKQFSLDRENRAYRICEYLNKKGIDVALEDIQLIAREGVIGRPHFAKYLEEHGYVKTREDAFKKYLDTKEFKFTTDRQKPTPKDAIEFIHQAGGKAFLAHPGLLKLGWKEIEDFIIKLKDYGLDGIECYYSRHTSKQTEGFLQLAKNYNLQISAGSDFHGEKVKPNIRLGYRILDEKGK